MQFSQDSNLTRSGGLEFGYNQTIDFHCEKALQTHN